MFSSVPAPALHIGARIRWIGIHEYDRTLAPYKRRHRRATGGGRLKRGADVPIAVLVPRVTIKKRLDVYAVIARQVPAMSAAIENELGRLG